MFRNKHDEHCKVTRNKDKLVAQGYNQEGVINYDEIFAPVARFEAIRTLLAFTSLKKFKLFQMDVKCVFLNSFVKKKVLLNNLPGLKISNFQIIFSNLKKLFMV